MNVNVSIATVGTFNQGEKSAIFNGKANLTKG